VDRERNVKSPAIAFLLSLIFPAGGLFYCGKFVRAFATAGFFVAGAGLFYAVASSQVSGAALELFAGAGLRVAIGLYVFGFLDAYFTAREINAGSEHWIGESPRVAAVLNLLANGLGYFYLGYRVQGLAVALAVTVAARIVEALPDGAEDVFQVLLEIILVVLAWDAWRLADRSRREDLLKAGSTLHAIRGGLSPLIPQGFAVLAAIGYAGLLWWGLQAPDWSSIDQSAAVVEPAISGATYRNPTYGVSLKAPPGWTFDPLDESRFANFSSPDGVCWGSFLADRKQPFASEQSLVNSLVRDLRAAAPDLDVLAVDRAEIAGRQGYGVRAFSAQKALSETLFVAEGEQSIYALLMFEREDRPGACEPALDLMRSNLVLEEPGR